MVEKGTNNLYLKGLDGLRALCALFILLGHISQTDFCDWGGREILSIPVPECCAYVFFVISGFLAGYRMETITSFRSYYLKKAWRLFPLYFTYVIIVIVVYLLLGWGEVVWNERLFYYLLLVPEIPFCTSTGILPMVHLWFIGVLALFYVLVPFLSRVDARRRKQLSLLLAVGWFLLKVFSYFVFGKNTFMYRFCGTTSFDILFFSTFIGLCLREKDDLSKTTDGWMFRIVYMIAWILFLGTGFYGQFIPAPIRPEYVSLLALVLIIGQQSSLPFFSLENKVFRWLGRISYEIYVIQLLVIILLSKLYLAAGASFPDTIVYLICCVMVVVCAFLMKKLISYCLVFGKRVMINKEKHQE